MYISQAYLLIEDRISKSQACNQSRQQTHRVKIGLQEDGTIVAMDPKHFV